MKTSFASISVCLAAGLTCSPPVRAYELHEWGTFTTVAGSDGQLLTGLEREEEPLPSYVKHLPRMSAFTLPGFKRVAIPVKNVRVKMETPVIYFHSPDAFRAEVKVGFSGGTISQWYPSRSGGEVFEGKEGQWLDFAEPYQGAIEWSVDVLSPQDSQQAISFHPDDLLTWTRARVPEANRVRADDGSSEGFLFYRGLGSFEPGLHTSVSTDETLHLQNLTGGDIPYLLVFERLADGGSRWYQAAPSLSHNKTLSISESDLKLRPSGFDELLYREIASHLSELGLLPSEAEAMVQTWWRSYFEAPGLRVFWVLPPSRTETLLPLEVRPAPDKVVRVLVGRSEVLRPRQERDWLHQATATDPRLQQEWWNRIQIDRFGAAYEARIDSLLASAQSSVTPLEEP
ncbi:hypothetical protein HNR46_002738 [Haloferula luteola]|uniref:Uncharacterized protein n=1 Tax=Haloferula luteola TaxID=595692 RepID=A0A840V3D5_9BACT|nr:hypothetical protein [Haloferula luteola]MBB5352492.1 hypothetical protein [Haloferula luteola]